MKTLAVWSAVAAAVIGAASIAVAHFGTSGAAMKQLASPGPLSSGHAYLANRCEACHQPTSGVSVANCTACHASAARLLGRQPTLFHESIEECAACHLEHQGVSPRPLVMDHLELAKVGARTLARAARRDPDSAATLASLEVWLRLRSPEKLDAGDARGSLNCAGCHDRRDPHFKRFGSDCAQCHILETWSVPGYLHPSPKSQACVQCHLPPPSHFMGHFAMISQKFSHKERARVDQCFECHNTTGWNDIVDVGFYKHH